MASIGDQGPAFGEVVTFGEEFPSVEVAEFRYTEWPVESHRDDGVRFHRNPGEFIRCGNPRCRKDWGSGLPAGELLRRMVENGLDTLETSETCRGMEKGRHPKYCLRDFRDIRVTIRYRATG